MRGNCSERDLVSGARANNQRYETTSDCRWTGASFRGGPYERGQYRAASCRLFVRWLNRFGERSYDPHDFWAWPSERRQSASTTVVRESGLSRSYPSSRSTRSFRAPAGSSHRHDAMRSPTRTMRLDSSTGRGSRVTRLPSLVACVFSRDSKALGARASTNSAGDTRSTGSFARVRSLPVRH
jgi:hypothetical protein